MKEYLYKARGFTYIELLIVVGIMLIFGAFLVASVNPVERIKTQRDSQRESDLNSILLSVQQKIKNDRGWDCPSEPLPQDKFTAIGTGSGEYDLYSCLMPNYLSKYLVDPKEGSSSGKDITNGLVGHWKFDEGNGTAAYDASGNGNDGTLMNGPAWVDGKMGGALDFDGAGDYVDAGNDASLNITDAITLSAWVKTNYSNTQTIAQKYTSAGRGLLLMVVSGHIRLDGRNGDYDGSYHSVAGTSNIVDDNWHHCVGVVDNSIWKVYVDGIEENSATEIPANLINSINFRIGAESPPSYFFKGLIDDVRIYNRALSPEEIQDLYNYEYLSKYAIWQNPVTKNISLKSIEDETKEVSTGAPELALDFDGNNDYVDCGNNASLNNFTAKTVLMWLKVSPIYVNDFQTIYYGGYWAGSKGDMIVVIRPGNKFYTYLKNTAGVAAMDQTTLFTPDEWFFYGYSWDGTTVKFYKNGAETISVGFSGTLDGSGVNKTLGGGYYNNFNGLIDDVRIYNRALSAEEVEQLYKGYDIRSGLVGHWPLNEGTGETAYDRSGNNNHGTLLPAGDGPTWTTK